MAEVASRTLSGAGIQRESAQWPRTGGACRNPIECRRHRSRSCMREGGCRLEDPSIVACALRRPTPAAHMNASVEGCLDLFAV